MIDNFEIYRSQQDISMEFYRLKQENNRLQAIVDRQREVLESVRDDYNAAIKWAETQYIIAIQSGEMNTATAFAMKEIRISKIRPRLLRIEQTLALTTTDGESK